MAWRQESGTGIHGGQVSQLVGVRCVRRTRPDHGNASGGNGMRVGVGTRPPRLASGSVHTAPHGETETGGDDEDEHEDWTRVSAAAGRAVRVAFGLRSLIFSSPRPVVFADASGMDPGPRARRRSLFKVRALKTARRRRPQVELRVHTASRGP